jgi:hypothetical protein
MTQTIKNCNEIQEGCVHLSHNLKKAESSKQLFDYINAGHPIATDAGYAVRLLRFYGEQKPYGWKQYHLDYFDGKHWHNNQCSEGNLLDYIKLAPLAYRNGRPLHVGDRIQIEDMFKRPWVDLTVTAASIRWLIDSSDAPIWRFADEVEAA